MAKPPAKPPQQGQDQIFLSIINNLQQRPAYLLIFAVVLLTYLYCGASILGAGGEDMRRYGLLGLFIETLVVVVTVVILERQSVRATRISELETQLDESSLRLKQARTALVTDDEDDINVKDVQARRCLASIVDDVRDGLNFDNAIFRKELIFQLMDFTKTSKRWAEGTLTTDAGNYERILRDFYRDAQNNVFATSNEEYMELWNRPEQASQILRAHREAFDRSGTRVTRVFVFSTLDRIQHGHVEVMKKHSREAYITAKVFLADENRNAAFDENLMRDFVIVDGGHPTQAIGITNTFEPDQMTARWIVGYNPNIEQTAQWIAGSSISVADLEARLAERD